MIVLDASAAIDLLLNNRRGAAVAVRLDRPGATLHAPHLLDVEVAHVLRRYVRSGDLREEQARDALGLLLDLDVERYGHDVLLDRIWRLRGSLTAYDAAYVALAEALGATLLTCDVRLAGACADLIEVDLIGP